MKGHVGLFMLGLGMAATGAMVYDKIRSGEIDTGKIGERVKEVSNDIAREMDELKDKMVDIKSRVSDVSAMSVVDINECSREELGDLGVPEEMLDRVIEGRPYRNKMDLLTRMIVPQDLYDSLKSVIEVRRPDEDVKVA